MILPEDRITGTQVAYYIICKRKLWFFTKGIEMESNYDAVIIGKIIADDTFKKEKYKEMYIGESIKIDFIKVGDKIVVHEVKKSRKMEEAHIWQVKFYIYSLKKYGINSDMGIIHYPKIMRKAEVILTDEDQGKIDRALSEISEIKRLPHPPSVINKPYCKKCAYYNLCYI